MVFAEIILSSFLTVLFEKLASAALIKLAQSAGIYSELNKLKTTLTLIQKVLADAGQKHITDAAVEEWLNTLQHLAYDIDDLLDDLATEAMRRHLNKRSHATTSNKVLKTLAPYAPRNFKYGLKMRSKLDDVTIRLDQLVKQITILRLVENVDRPIRTTRRREETSLVGASTFVGREKDKEALLSKLLEDESNNRNFDVVSIVGLGGIGKTALAQDLYNDKKVEDHFELKAWVCVSDEFDVFTISNAIFQAVGGGDRSFANLNLLQVALKEKLSKKKFLLVLDDVWDENDDEWELLQRPFVVGEPGSKVIATTRSIKVASAMDSVQAYPLAVLSEEAALSLFAQHALGEQNFDKHSKFKPLGEGIIKKCKGLPLALKTLGWVLRTKKNADEWEELLNNAIWKLHNESKILPALRLSYHDLPSRLKRLFAYCCLFPKDYMFDKDELVLLWMAEGFLHEQNASKLMESFGREYFDELVSRSFFQHSTDKISRYVMHDLIHDLATIVGGEFFFTLDVKIGNEASENVRHLSFIPQTSGEYRKFKALQRARRLRTFLSVPMHRWQKFELSNKSLDDLLPQLQFLRVLNLSNHSISKVPQSIGSLMHIRYINLSNTNITCLPDQVTELYNLQSLLLCRCYALSSLPDGFAKLINLRHLDIRDTPKLKKLPSGMGGLTSLQTLPKAIIDGANGFRISDLKDLLHLRGQLDIEGLHNVRDRQEAKEANLHQKKDLEFLNLEWGKDFDDSRIKMKEDEVLEGLRPHSKLRNLKIWYYGGMKFPSWVGDSSFNQLTELTLVGCRNCEYLPAVGQLGSLRELYVSNMNEVKTVGVEFLASTSSFHGDVFPKLEVLSFRDMQSWERWSNSDGDNGTRATVFCCLRQIKMRSCLRLTEVSLDLIPSLEELSISDCSAEVLRSMIGVSSSIVELEMIDVKGHIQLDEEVLKQLGKVEDLVISDCHELRYLWESEAKACKFLPSLKKLEVRRCDMLVSLGKEEDHLGINLTSPREVKLNGCKSLKSYKCGHGIEKLRIDGCGSMTSLTFPEVQDLPSCIKSIEIVECAKLEGSWLLNNFLSSLESLLLWRSDKMMSFPGGWFVNLISLSIWDCHNIESIPDEGFGFLPLFCLKTLSIDGCKNLKAFPHKHLPRLTSLEKLDITDCPSLDDSFPCGLWPPKLRSLRIGCLNKPMSEWGLQDFPTSLVVLNLEGKNSGMVSFADAEDVRNNTSSSSFLLPPSLTCLDIRYFEDFKSVSKGLQHLTCLETLVISSCPKLEDLPEELLPSLSKLIVERC